ncbi:hypothetical protein NKJ13_08035 [Mesorhizobium sp. M0174]|uniref:hypothetical protein n=1 Tax=Mesorhizobium sp. M0174 TaxID=2956904 RepID=UPI00333D21A8
MAGVSRRTVLVGAVAAAAAAMLPTVGAEEAPRFIGIDLGAQPDVLGFAVGTPGEYDWISVTAKSAEEAWAQWCDHQGYGLAEERVFCADYVTRVPQWDGKDPDSIRPADWLKANLGHCCERCGYETHPESGARIIAGDVVCEECMTFADRLVDDPDDAVDELANRIADDGADEVREQLIADGDWPLAVELWPRALAAAGEDQAA